MPDDLPKPVRGRGRRAKRRLAAETALSHRFEFETFEPRILMSAALLPVHGSIDVPGQTNQYTFSLTSATQIYFDSQTPNSSNIDWTLQGPTGTLVSDRSFEYTDANQVNGPVAISVPAGQYTLTVSGQNNVTGAYDFQILDLANSTPITVGQSVAGQLNPADSTQLYQFNATAGDQLFFDSHTLNAQSTTWRVIGPDGNLIFGPTPFGQDPATDTVTDSGTYTLMVEGNVNQTGTAAFSFTVYPVTTTQAPLSLNQSTTGTLVTPGAINTYDFTLAQPTTVLFDSLTNNANVQWTLSGSTGTLRGPTGFNASDGFSLGGGATDATTLAAGTYQISVSGVGSTVGSYGFELLDLASATPSPLSDTISGTIDDAGASATSLHTTASAPLSNPGAPGALALGNATISGTVANTPLLQSQTLTVEAWVRLDYTAAGQMVIFQQGASGSGYALQVGTDGNLQFVVGGAIAEATGPLQLGTWTQVAGTYDGSTLSLYVNGALVASQAQASPISYDTNGATIGAADNSGAALWQGELDEVRVWNVAQSASAIAANMALALGPTAGLVADWHLNEPSGLTLADSSGNGLNATLGPIPGTATQLLSFNLTAGQTYYLNVPASNGNLEARLFNPTGYQVFAHSLQNIAGITAEVSGTYTLAIEGGVGNTKPATYSIAVAPSTTALGSFAVGAISSDSISLPGQSVAYSFTLADTTQLLFDTISSDPNLQYSISGAAQGPIVTNQALQTADSIYGPTNALLTLAPDTYTITMTGIGSATGAYSFRMLDAATATPASISNEATATLDVPTGTVLTSFTANAGDTVSFNVDSGIGSAVWQLFDPYGRPVFGPSYVNNAPGVALGATGT